MLEIFNSGLNSCKERMHEFLFSPILQAYIIENLPLLLTWQLDPFTI